MNDNIKNYLGIAAIIAILAFAYASISYVGSYSKSIEPSSFRSFSVSGQGKVVAIPDVAQFTFSVITEGGTDIANLQKENADKTSKAISFLKANGVEDKDIKTQSYDLTPRYQHFPCDNDILPIGSNGSKSCLPPTIVGYTITQTASVKIRNFEKIGKILSGVIENGANSVSQLYFAIDDETDLQNQARAKAIAQAKNKAKSIAKAGGFGLGRLISIQEGFSPGPIRALGVTSESQQAVPIIEPGSQEITVDITLTYEIE